MHRHRHLRLDRRQHQAQLLGGLGEEVGGGSSLQQTAEEEFGELSFLLGEPQVQYSGNTDITNGNNIR